jgi:hypothetical protein
MEVVILGAAAGGPAAVSGFGAIGAGIGAATGATGLGALGGGAAVTGLGALGAGAAGAAVTGLGALGGGAAGAAAAAALGAVGAAAGAGLPGEITTLRSLAPKTPATSSGTSVRFWSARLASPPGPIAARIRDNGKSIRESSCEESFANVPGGEPWRNCAKGILTAPVRNCSAAKAAERKNIPAGRSKTSAAKSSGSHERISFNGNAIISPVSAVLRGGTGAGDGAAGFGARAAAAGAAGAAGVEGFAGGAGAGVRTEPSVAGAAGGVLVDLENNLLKTPNIILAAVHPGRTISARR